jgi:hypothetical protein
MRHALSIVALLLFACTAAARASTYSEALGIDTIRDIVQRELARASRESRLSLSEGAIDWVIEAAGNVESSNDRETATDELQEGLHAFFKALGDYAIARDLGSISRSEVEEFQATTATCGMIPCSRRCCRRCQPC